MRKKLLSLFVIGLLMGTAITASADIIYLDFEEIGNFNPVGDYYNGGAGPNYGIAFSDNTLALVDIDADGDGNFGGEPSPDTIMFFTTGTASIMNVEAGFDTGFSFYYSAPYNTGSLTVWNSVDGMGSILATLDLPLTPVNGAPDPNGIYSPLLPLGVSFSGTAKSVTFAGVANSIGFDNITLGSDVPVGAQPTVPEPTTMLLLGTGLVGVAGAARRRKKNQA